MRAQLRPPRIFSRAAVMPHPARPSRQQRPDVRTAFYQENTMHQYLLLLHETPGDFTSLSPAQMQDEVARYRAWSGQMAERGLLVSGEKLTDDGGRHLRAGASAPLASDGPYAEAKDVIGGFFMIKAESDAHAEQIAAACPHLRGRNWIEIRRIDALQ
jgi:hypothetical protein